MKKGGQWPPFPLAPEPVEREGYARSACPGASWAGATAEIGPDFFLLSTERNELPSHPYSTARAHGLWRGLRRHGCGRDLRTGACAIPGGGPAPKAPSTAAYEQLYGSPRRIRGARRCSQAAVLYGVRCARCAGSAEGEIPAKGSAMALGVCLPQRTGPTGLDPRSTGAAALALGSRIGPASPMVDPARGLLADLQRCSGWLAGGHAFRFGDRLERGAGNDPVVPLLGRVFAGDGKHIALAARLKRGALLPLPVVELP